jgi:Family of unknown function (DUF6113)
MGTPQGPLSRDQRALNAVCYLVLLVLGLMLGLIGSFQYSQGPVPLVAIALDLAIFLACLLGGWGMRSYAGGILPAIGWFISSFVLSMGRATGSVIITATTAGEWYLYGGALAAAAGAAATFVLWSRARSRQR